MADIVAHGGIRFPVTHATDLSSLIGLPVVINESVTALYDVELVGAGAQHWGILINYDGDTLKEGEIMYGGVTRITLAATIARRAEFEWDASGHADTLSTGQPGGWLLEAGDDGDVVMAFIYPPSADTDT